MCNGINSLVGLTISYSKVLTDLTSFTNIGTCSQYNTTAMTNSNCQIFNTNQICISCMGGYYFQSDGTCSANC